ncbi:MAG: DUF3078 domain-containing protein [Bacteroidetes bacterium]|nr:DUF3078 domain-containing protein [Bacteroidota bacterium]
MKYLLVLGSLLVSALTFAQTEEVEKPKYWTHKASFGLNFSNITLHNWAGGGDDALAVATNINGQLQYKKDKVTWLNTLELGYGQVRNESVGEFRKSDDRLILVSKYSRSFGTKGFAYSAIMDFRTQMDVGLKYFEREGMDDSSSIISRFLAPGYLTLAAGMEYKPTDNFYFMLSPVSGKLTFVMDDVLAAAGAFGVEPDKNLLAELGAVSSLRWYVEPFAKSEGIAGKALKNVSYETKLNLFQAYKKGKALDFIWDNTLLIKANDYISTTFTAQYIYDEDVAVTRDDLTVGPAVQSKYVLAVGFLMKF